MSGIIHFVSGKTLEITDAEFRGIAPKLNSKGIRCHKSEKGHLIPMNSTTMEFIEYIEEEEKPEEVIVENKPAPVAEPKEEPKSPDEVMNDILAKSSCTHEKQSLYIQHTAKGVRYFPVCDFCGKRDRYVSEKKVLDGEYENWKYEDIENAIPWTE